MGSVRQRNNNIKVSVVVAVYNSAKYLRQTLDSILAQTLSDIEIILVDDGSTDSSLDILNEYSYMDGRVTVLRQVEQSDGAALARNLGVSKARGEYLSVLDADDIFEPYMLQNAYHRARETDADVVIFDGDVYDEKLDSIRETGMILRREFLPDKDVFAPRENRDKLFFMTIGAAWNVLFKREFIARENLKFHSFHHADDLGFVYLGFSTASKIAVLPERLIHYRCNNSNSQASNLEKWPESCAGAMIELKKDLEKRGLFETYKVTFTEIALHYFDLYLNRMPNDGFRRFFLEWKDRYLEELELCDIPDDRLIQKRIAKIRRRLIELTPEQYILDKNNKCGLFEMDDAWRSVIEPESKVILYCAGKRGQETYDNLIGLDICRVVAWVDSNYEDYDCKVTDPIKALKHPYDYILVAIESQSIFERIRDSLIDRGVNSDKIIWSEGLLNESE